MLGLFTLGEAYLGQSTITISDTTSGGYHRVIVMDILVTRGMDDSILATRSLDNTVQITTDLDITIFIP
jgi:hypothetical protein